IELKRRRPKDNKVTPFRFNRVGHLDELTRKAARWCSDHRIEVATMEAPAELDNFANAREADNWEPLLVIATIAGGGWPKRGLEAATAVRAKAGDGGEQLEMLLEDIRAVFPPEGRDPEKKDEISSATLVEKLVALEGRPWAEIGKNDKPLTQNKL